MGSVFLITDTTGTGIAIIAGADADSVAPSAWSPAMRKPTKATMPIVARAAREILRRIDKLQAVIRRLRRGAEDERRHAAPRLSPPRVPREPVQSRRRRRARRPASAP